MGGLIKLISILILLTGLAVYGGDIWNGVRGKISEYTHPELQKASLLNSLKKDFNKVQDIIQEIGENIDNQDFDKKALLEEAKTLVNESKNNLAEIENSDSTLVKKTFETLNDLKQGAQSLFSNSKIEDTQNSRCEVETK